MEVQNKNELTKPVSNYAFFADSAMAIERIRVAIQVRASHLRNEGREDPDTNELLKRAKSLETFAEEKLKGLILNHPTYPWWRRISGCYPVLMAKIIGCIENFGKYYKLGDELIPDYVKREAIGNENGESYIWVEGIERFTNPSKLWKYAGLVPELKRETGKRLQFNIELKTLLFRLMQFGFFFKAERSKYYQHYSNYKERRRISLANQGILIKPTPRGRFCLNCKEEKKVPKDTYYCPDCGARLGKKEETKGVIWEGHLDFMARRHTIKLFLSHLWLVWRKALDLPVGKPYPVEHLGHTTVISPWDMCDLPESEIKIPELTIPKLPRLS